MANLLEEQLIWIKGRASDATYDESMVPVRSDWLLSAVAELRRHRAMVKRLEEWAEQLDEPGKGRALARELRNRMKGT